MIGPGSNRNKIKWDEYLSPYCSKIHIQSTYHLQTNVSLSSIGQKIMMTLQYSPAFLFVLKHDRIAQDSYQFYWKSKFYNVKENCSLRVLCKIDPNIKIEYIFPVKAKPHTPLDQFCPDNSSSFLKS